MPTKNKEREMGIAQRRVKGFTQQFGEAHRNLARHAAFPLVLTPDLLYQIWANFVSEAPWTAVARVLLSRLCRQVGYEMYEMDIADRNLLLRELKQEFGQERFDELGEFLLDYVAQRLTDDDADTRDLREAQEWTALAYTKPDEAAQELKHRLSKRIQENIGEDLRLASLVETLAEPLLEAGFKPLLVYSKAMLAVSDGEQRGTVSQLRHLISLSDKKLDTILCYLYEELGQDDFIEFVIEHDDYFEDIEQLLSVMYNNEYFDFESFVDLAIQTLKPDFDGKVYVKYNRYYSTHDEGERYVGSLGQEAEQIQLSQVPEFITESNGDSLGVFLEDKQEVEIVLSILSSGEYELPDSDIEDGTVEISIQEPELFEDSYEEYESYVDVGETVESTENKISVQLDEELVARKERSITGENQSNIEQTTSFAENSTPSELRTNQPFSLSSTKYKIMIIDDSPDNIFLIKTILEEEAYQVSAAENGIDALSMIEASPPDLIILDLMMPGMDGYEVTKNIRQNSTLPFIPILLISAHDSPNIAQGLDLGANDFIRKPVTVDELLARVRALLRIKKMLRKGDRHTGEAER